MMKMRSVLLAIILLFMSLSSIAVFADYSAYEELYGPVEPHQKLLQHLFDSELDPYGWGAMQPDINGQIVPGSKEKTQFVQGAYLTFEDMVDPYNSPSLPVSVYKCISPEEAQKAIDGLIQRFNNSKEWSSDKYNSSSIMISSTQASYFKQAPSGSDKSQLYSNVFWSKDEYLFLVLWAYNDIQQPHIDFFEKLTAITLNYEKASTANNDNNNIIDSNTESTTSHTNPQTPKDIDLQISWEIDPSTGTPYQGIVADGFTEINLIIKNKGYEGSLTINPGKLGDIIGSKTKKISPQTSEIIFKYRPFEYIETSVLTGYIKDFKLGEAVECYTAKDTIQAAFTGKDNSNLSFNLDIQLFNPPVALVHGFTGDEETWRQLDDFLTGKKYDTLRKEYYAIEDQGGIELQAQKLHSDITALSQAYHTAGLKAGRVDIVGHSMGGLISRYYDKNLSNNSVRKLLMVGTPNHGVPRLDQLMGIFISSALTKEHLLESYQLSSDNPLIIELNQGENKGLHLKKDVQYAVIYGYGSSLGGDGIVNEYSAMLNGVESYGYNGHSHSPVLENLGLGKSLTVSPEVLQKIQELLSDRIFRTPLGSVSMDVDFAKGAVMIDGLEASADDSLLTGETLETKDGEARIILINKNIVYGHIDVSSYTKIKVEYIAPEEIELYVIHGEIRINEYPETGRGAVVSCLLTQNDKLQKVRTKGTDYTVWVKGSESGAYCLDGQIELVWIDSLTKVTTKPLSYKEAVKISPTLENTSYTREVWWNTGSFEAVIPMISTGIAFLDKWINVYFNWLKSITGLKKNMEIIIAGSAGALIVIILIISILAALVKLTGRKPQANYSNYGR